MTVSENEFFGKRTEAHETKEQHSDKSVRLILKPCLHITLPRQ